MYSIEIVLTMLLAVVASGYLVRVVPVALPMPLMQIAMGAVIAGVFNHGVTLDPEIFFLVFLPPLLFLDGWRIPKDASSATRMPSCRWRWASWYSRSSVPGSSSTG